MQNVKSHGCDSLWSVGKNHDLVPFLGLSAQSQKEKCDFYCQKEIIEHCKHKLKSSIESVIGS